ncbi:MAG: hypothetical protein IJZ58_01735 [Oscillospiraceae bacterium]|nr:hypothetical protein [Oscillospiraceae bacterium]
MKKLKLKATAEAAAILLGFFIFGILLSFLFDEVTAELFRLVILEWGAFPMLCAITGGVVSAKNGFMPIYGILSGVIFLPFMFFFFETNWGLAVAYALFGALGSLFGHWLYLKEVRRIEEGRPEKRRKSIIFSMFDRYDTKKYK